MKVLIALVCLLALSSVFSAELTVMHGASAGHLDKAKLDVAYALAHNMDPLTAPPEFAPLLLLSQKIVDTENDIGTDPTNQQILAGLNGMSSREECQTYRETDLPIIPICFLSWEDTTIGVNDCQGLITCATPGAQLCSAVGGLHTMVKRNKVGTICRSTCQVPSVQLRIKCQ